MYAVPSELGDNRENAAELLAEIVHSDARDNFTSQQQMLARFNASRNFAWVARRLDPETATRVRELNLKGVYFQKEFKRFYPNNDLAAQVLGYVGTDDTGLGGLEREFDDDMHGDAGACADGAGCEAACAGKRREPAYAGREPGAVDRREHPVHGGAGAGCADGEDEGGARDGGGAGPAYGTDSGAGDLAAIQSERSEAYGCECVAEPGGE